jgi:hypothetical protein
MALFQKLWDNYAYGAPCSTNGVRNYENQCAIRIGTTFVTNGISLKNANLTMCSYHPKSAGHTLRARELATALDRGAFSNISPTKKYRGTEGWLNKISGKTGIVYFRHYYKLDGTPDGSLNGDHIDLWNRGRITDSWNTFWRLTVQDGGAYNKGSIWFWEIT